MTPDAFRPPAGLGSGHAQTVWAALMRPRARVSVSSEVWHTDDGDVLDVDLLPDQPGAPGVIVLHGLEGSSRTAYVRAALAELERRGWNGLALNFRSCGPSPPRGARLYHSGDTRDFAFVVARAAQRWGNPRLGALGYSLGGNALLKWLGELKDEAPIAAAVAVSVPFDLAACARALDAPGFWPRVYRGRFLRTLRRKALALAAAHPQLDRRALAEASTFTAFDDRFTAPMNGFRDAADYWAQSSSAGFLPFVRRPTLIVAAEDDPFVPAEALPRDAIAANPALTAWISAQGGHVAFVTGSLLRPRYLAERLAFAHLDRHLGG